MFVDVEEVKTYIVKVTLDKRRSANEERLVYLQVIFDESVEERDYDIAVPTTTTINKERDVRIGY